MLILRTEPDATWPRQARLAGAGGVMFVANDACAECHTDVFERWTGSHHDLAMQAATPDTVLGDFADVASTHRGVTSRFFQRDGRFFVNTEGPDGGLADFEVAYTFGVEPLQQYLVAFPGGRLQSLTTAWNTERGEWFHLYPDERVEPGDALHWTGPYQTWNVTCAECHSTDLRQQSDTETGAYRTTWAEINVSCQACHGPGAAHLAWARQEDSVAVEVELSLEGLVVTFGEGDPAREVDRCARCHSRRSPISVEDAHGRPFLDDFIPATLREGLYHADGQILDEVYVYGSFVQSKMFEAGVRCSNCHDPHSLEVRGSGNAVCTQCHRPSPPDLFPTLPARSYDAPSHHFHEANSEGARCVSCHMPTRTYMVVDPRRDHSFRVPRPDLSVAIGTPDTCTSCHTDRTREWAAEQVGAWYGDRPPGPDPGETIAAARRAEPDAELPLIALASDPERPAIIRATALELLRGYGGLATEAMVAATRDPESMVRVAAAGGLTRLAPERRADVAGPLLEDPSRAVRQQAARVLAPLPAETLDPAVRAARDAVLAEYRDAQRAQAESPAAHLNLGVLAASQGDQRPAERSYRAALDLDGAFLPASFNLANLYNQLGRNAEAELVLQRALDEAPDEGELHYSLGLLWAEEERLAEAAESLGRAAALLPDRSRVHYNYGLSLQRLGRLDDAEAPLMEAWRLNPQDPAVPQSLAIFYAQRRDWDAARRYAEALSRLLPGEPGPQQLLNQIQLERLRDER